MPKWIDGIADTNCIATPDSMAAVIDRSGCRYVSHDDGDRRRGSQKCTILELSKQHP